MPTMPRLKSNATKIAYKLLGVPANIAHKPTKQEVYINKRLRYFETNRAR